MKSPHEMSDAELFEVIGLPAGCPKDIAYAVFDRMVQDWTRVGIGKVQAAAREQARWSQEQKENARLASLVKQRRTARSD